MYVCAIWLHASLHYDILHHQTQYLHMLYLSHPSLDIYIPDITPMDKCKQDVTPVR